MNHFLRLKTLFATGFLLCGCSAIAQSQKPKGTVEIRAMINQANVKESDGSNSYNYSSIVRQNVGVLGHVPVGKGFWISPGLFYNWAGAKTDVGDLHLNYLNIPLLLKYVPLQNGVLEIYAGPQFGLLLKSIATNNSPFVTNGDASRFFVSSDVSGVGGISVVVPKSPLVVMAQYQLGLSDIADHKVVPQTNSFKNRILSFGIGYRF